jgi:hypothetical protein
MTIKIDQKIVGYSVVKPGDDVRSGATKSILIERPEVIPGRTHKIKSPLSDSALYVTLNCCEVDGVMRPFELFINSRDTKHHQWTVALTRLISAIFRHGGEVSFLIDELHSVIDPNGGGFHKGRYVPSIVSLIGDVIETELVELGLHTKDESLKEAAKEMIAEKKAKLASVNDDGYPKEAIVCDKCQHRALVMMDQCLVCLNCASSKCG